METDEYRYDAGAVIASLRVLEARAEAGDRRAVEALKTHPLVSRSWLADRRPERPTLTAWVGTWLCDPEHERADGEAVEAWALRQCRLLGMSTMEAVAWLRGVLGRG